MTGDQLLSALRVVKACLSRSDTQYSMMHVQHEQQSCHTGASFTSMTGKHDASCVVKCLS